ncbi:MAG: hypothetical protein COU51_04890 [Parcubacteria group bacterium CG10_big_fil_rev_8_21_14_0_10_36_14]|nr:MAG: hypothetical protein COU51_04890 [Parcubacteria group bacterium CG10_big_fil_rev_8_21_14_0_10_36_14]
MKKIFAVLVIIFCFVGCATKEEKRQVIIKRARHSVWSIHYVKDYRSDICFATRCWQIGVCQDLTMVPCTEKVMTLIVNPRESECKKDCYN